MKKLNIKQKPKKEKKPPTTEMKGLHLYMGGVFMLIVRLMVTNGLESLSLMAAGLLFAAGFIRWRKMRGCKSAAAVSLVLTAAGFFEIIRAAAADETERNIMAVVLVLAGCGAAIYTALRALGVCVAFCRAERAEETAGILRQRKWWVGIGYGLCSVWALIDALTGLYPNVGVVMRIAAILVDVFFLSALFQVRNLLDK